MARTLSQNLRDRVIAAVDGGMSDTQPPSASECRWRPPSAGSGLGVPTGFRCHGSRVATGAQADITLVELSALLLEQHDVSSAPSTIWRFLDRHGMTFKGTAHACKQERPDVAMRRQAWFDAQPDLDPAHLVFIDA